MTTALTFNETTFHPVQRKGYLWIRASELANALGFSREELVSRIYKRHEDEFTDGMTQVIENVAEHQNGVLVNGRCRIFSPRGCHLIAMFARTPVAKAFRRWVLDVLDNINEQNAAPAVPAHVDPEQLSTNQSRKPLRLLVSAWAQMTGCSHSSLWPQVKAHFQLESIKDLPEAWLPDALAFVQAKIDALSAGLPEHEPALPTLPTIPEQARMELEAIDKKKESAAWVADQCLQKALAHLDHAFQHAGLMANTGNCPIEGYRPSLYIAAMSNINSAAAIVRAMISAEGVRLR